MSASDTVTREQVQAWEKVREAVGQASSMHFDGCHKVYLAMDAEQTAWFDGGMNAAEPDFDKLRDWYDESCPLRFVDAVRTTPSSPDVEFTTLIPQGFGEDAHDPDETFDNDDDEDDA